MPAQQAAGTVATLTTEDLKTLAYFATALLGAITSIVLAVAWVHNQKAKILGAVNQKESDNKVAMDQLSKTIYSRIRSETSKIQESISHNKDDCRDTKERVSILEKDMTHYGGQLKNTEETIKEVKQSVDGMSDRLNQIDKSNAENTILLSAKIESIEKGIGETLQQIREAIDRRPSNE